MRYGTDTADTISRTYCVNNTSASDYGNCYNITIYTGKPIFVQSDTTTYPSGSLACETNNTCIRYTSTASARNIATVFAYSGKQGIMQFFRVRVHLPFVGFIGNINYLDTIPIPAYNTNEAPYSSFLPAVKYNVSSWPIYDPVANFEAYLNPYNITSGYVHVIRWNGNYFTPTLYILSYEGGQNNIWYAFDLHIVWAYESSPLAIIPLDYNNDYAPYRELRNAFGYAYTGIDQPGWNAQDMISALNDIFPNRAWAVYDDVQKILYLYNLTIDYVPDWLISKLAPVGIKVLQTPSDSSIAQAWLNALNARNPQSSGP